MDDFIPQTVPAAAVPVAGGALDDGLQGGAVDEPPVAGSERT